MVDVDDDDDYDDDDDDNKDNKDDDENVASTRESTFAAKNDVILTLSGPTHPPLRPP